MLAVFCLFKLAPYTIAIAVVAIGVATAVILYIHVVKIGVHLQLVRTVYMWLEELEGMPLLIIICCSMLQTAALLSDLTQNLYQSISINTVPAMH